MEKYIYTLNEQKNMKHWDLPEASKT